MLQMVVMVMVMNPDKHPATLTSAQLMVTGVPILNGRKVHHAQEVVAVDKDAWLATVNVLDLMVEGDLVLEVVKKPKVYPVVHNLAQPTEFGEHGTNCPVVNHAE